MFLKGHQRLENILDISMPPQWRGTCTEMGWNHTSDKSRVLSWKKTDKIEYRNMKDNPRLLEVHFTPSLYAVLKTSPINLKQHKQEILQKTRDT